MKVLLDTHTLLCAASEPHLLGREAAKVLSNPANVVMISAASAWEISTKVRLGKLPKAEIFEQNFIERVQRAGYVFREITAADGLRAGRLIGAHGDPFDRIIAAQALADDISIVSVDSKLDGFGVRRIW